MRPALGDEEEEEEDGETEAPAAVVAPTDVQIRQFHADVMSVGAGLDFSVLAVWSCAESCGGERGGDCCELALVQTATL